MPDYLLAGPAEKALVPITSVFVLLGALLASARLYRKVPTRRTAPLVPLGKRDNELGKLLLSKLDSPKLTAATVGVIRVLAVLIGEQI